MGNARRGGTAPPPLEPNMSTGSFSSSPLAREVRGVLTRQVQALLSIRHFADWPKDQRWATAADACMQGRVHESEKERPRGGTFLYWQETSGRGSERKGAKGPPSRTRPPNLQTIGTRGQTLPLRSGAAHPQSTDPRTEARLKGGTSPPSPASKQKRTLHEVVPQPCPNQSKDKAPREST